MSILKFKKGDRLVFEIKHTVVNKGIDRTGYILKPCGFFVPAALQDQLVLMDAGKKEREEYPHEKVQMEQKKVRTESDDRGSRAGVQRDPVLDPLRVDDGGLEDGPVRLKLEVKKCCARCAHVKIEVAKDGIENQPTVVGCSFRDKCADYLFSADPKAEGVLFGGN